MKELPKGRQPKLHLAIRPKLALAFRHVARRERKQLSDLFREMFQAWLSQSGKKWADEVDLDDE